MRKRILKISAIVVAVVFVLMVGLGLWVRSQVAGSLPQLEGEITLAALTATVVVERDGLGIPTIRAANRIDLAFATGFVHAQDRFFQMDLLRRNSAGELAEIIGPAVFAICVVTCSTRSALVIEEPLIEELTASSAPRKYER